MHKITDVPNGWQSAELKDIATINPKLSFDNIPDDTEVSFLPMKLVEEEINKIHLSVFKKYAEVRKGFTPMTDGDVIFAKITPCMENGKIAVVHSLRNKIAFGSTEFHVFRCNDAIINYYLFYFLIQSRVRQDAQHNMSGAVGQRRVPKKYLEELKIPLPPLPEQHRIVARIEELFSSLDKGIESLKTAQQQLKVYRQSVLKWAFEGQLTEVFRNTNNQLKDANNILVNIRKNRENWFKKNGKKLKLIADIDSHDLPVLPNKWCWVKIVETVLNTADDIVDGPFGSNLKNSDYVDGAPVPVIGISNIEEGFDKKIRYITNEKFQTVKRSAVYPGDIIVAKIGSTYGKTGTYPEWMPIGVIPANLLRIRPSEHYNKKLLIHYLQSIVFKKRLDKIMKSTAQPAFNVSMFKDLPIPFMSLEEQNQLVAEIESRLSVCDKIEQSIEESLKQAEALRQSILKKAFEGKLVPQDPDDEPASKLLERIKAEKEKTASIKRSRA